MLFALIVVVFTKYATKDVIKEAYCAYEIVLTSETIEDLQKDFEIVRKHLKIKVWRLTSEKQVMIGGRKEDCSNAR